MAEKQRPTFNQIIQQGIGDDMAHFQELSTKLPMFTGPTAQLFTALHEEGGLVRVIGTLLRASPGDEQVDARREVHGRMIAFIGPDEGEHKDKHTYIIAIPNGASFDLCHVGQEISPDGEQEDRFENVNNARVFESNFGVSDTPLIAPLWNPKIGVRPIEDFVANISLFTARVINKSLDMQPNTLDRVTQYVRHLKNVREKKRSDEEPELTALGVDVFNPDREKHAADFKAWDDERKAEPTVDH